MIKKGKIVMSITPMPSVTDYTLTDGMAEHTKKQERVEAWKKKLWLNFCTKVMESDGRFTLYPIADFNRKYLSMDNYSEYKNRDRSLFEGWCLRRDGELHDVFILPSDGRVGITIFAGSRTQHVKILAKPTVGFVIPAIEVSDELEAQYNTEVEKAKTDEHFARKKMESDVANVMKHGAMKYALSDPRYVIRGTPSPLTFEDWAVDQSDAGF